MANSISATYSFTLPEVGADTNAWGGHLNGNFTIIDQQMVSRTLVTAQTLAGALALPSNGLNVGSGQLQVTGGNVTASGNITATGNLGGVNGNFSGTLSAAGTTTLGVVNASGAATFATTMSVTGIATFTVPVVASSAPTLGTHLTNKTYVDDIKTTVDAYTITAGTSLTGGGAINTSPTISVAAGGITATQLASNAVTTVKISDANITAAKLNGAQSGSAPIFGARAWGRIDSAGALTAGGNTASASRTATGTYNVTFTTAMASANYAVVATVEGAITARIAQVSTKSTTGFTVLTSTETGNAESWPFSFIVIQ